MRQTQPDYAETRAGGGAVAGLRRLNNNEHIEDNLMTRHGLLSRLVARVKKALAAKPCPCWTDYLHDSEPKAET